VSSIGVLQVVLSLGPGGTERLVIDIVKRLRRRFRMSVCCLDERGAWADQLEAVDVPVTTCGRRPGFRPEIGRQIAALAERAQAQVLHCHHYTPFVYGALAAYRPPRPAVIFTEHGRLSNRGPSLKRRLANRLLARVPARVYAVSGDLARHVAAEGFDRAPVEVVHNGIDPGSPADPCSRARARHALGIDARAFVVATVARVVPVKDLGTLVRAFARVTDRVGASRLVIIGDGPERGALEALVSCLDLRDRVCFTGVRGDARDLLPAADVYVNTSVTEGTSLTILEAMAAGLPVVATNVGGTPEVLDDGTCGLLVPPGDAGTIALAIERLAADAPLRTRLGDAARTRVLARFTLDAMIATYADAYEYAGGR
jgi:glycosyltransferase involved in cell wall biosynthesis